MSFIIFDDQVKRVSPVSPETVPLLAFGASILWFSSESLMSHYGHGDAFDMRHSFCFLFFFNAKQKMVGLRLEYIKKSA